MKRKGLVSSNPGLPIAVKFKGNFLHHIYWGLAFIIYGIRILFYTEKTFIVGDPTKLKEIK